MKYFLTGALFVLLTGCMSNGNQEVYEENVKVGKVEFKELDGGEWAMTGHLININDHQIRGKAEIVLFKKNDQKLSEFSTRVNDGNPIAPGDSGKFEYRADKSTFAGAARYHIKFMDEKEGE